MQLPPLQGVDNTHLTEVYEDKALGLTFVTAPRPVCLILSKYTYVLDK